MVAKRKIEGETTTKPEAKAKGFNGSHHIKLILAGVAAVGEAESGLQNELIICLRAGLDGRKAIEAAAAKLAEPSRNKDSGKVQASTDEIKRLRSNLRLASIKWNVERGQKDAKPLTITVKDRAQNIWAVEEARGIERKALDLDKESVQEAYAAKRAGDFVKTVKEDLKARGVDEKTQTDILFEAIIDLSVMLGLTPEELADNLAARLEATEEAEPAPVVEERRKAA